MHKVVLSNIKQHVDSRGHKEKTRKTKAATSKDISSFLTCKLPGNSEWSRPAKQLWQGFYKDKFSYISHGVTIKVDPKILLHDLKPRKDKGKVSWYPEPFFVLNETGHEKITGTFWSSNCLRAADAAIFPDNMCLACSNIPKLESFRKQILLRNEKTGEDTTKEDTTCVRNEYLTSRDGGEAERTERETLSERWPALLRNIESC